MPRPILIPVILLAVVLVALIALAALDRETPVTHVERPIANEAAK